MDVFWGIGQCVALEAPAAYGGLVDLSTEVSFDVVARTLLDLIARGPADRLVAARELAARAAELDRLLRAAMATDASDAAAGPPTTQLGRSRRGARATAPGAGR